MYISDFCKKFWDHRQNSAILDETIISLLASMVSFFYSSMIGGILFHFDYCSVTEIGKLVFILKF